MSSPLPSFFRLHRITDVIALAIAFFFVFLAFLVVQNMASTVLPSSTAFPTLGTLYFSFAFFNLFGAAPLIGRIGTRPAMFIASITYTVFDACEAAALVLDGSVGKQLAVLLPASILIGAGAAVLWASQGAYVVKCSTKRTIGTYTGIFFGIMNASNVVGPLFTEALLQAHIDKKMAFAILTGIGAVGPLIILIYVWWLRPEPANPEREQTVAVETVAPKSKSDAMLKAARVSISKEMLLLAPLFLLNACEYSFNTGSLPLFVKTDSPAEDLKSKLFLSAACGGSLTIAAFAIGPITDAVGNPSLIICIDAIAHMAVLVALWLHPNPVNNWSLLYPCGIVVSFSDAVLINQSYKLIAGLFPADETAYAAYKFYLSAAIGTMFFASNAMLSQDHIPLMQVWVPLTGVLFIIAIMCTWLAGKGIEWTLRLADSSPVQVDSNTTILPSVEVDRLEDGSGGTPAMKEQ